MYQPSVKKGYLLKQAKTDGGDGFSSPRRIFGMWQKRFFTCAGAPST